MKQRHNQGFTIVELLIVIVVIGILAAIVIVAYNGIQERARAAKFQTDAKAIVGKAEAYRVLHGTYPNGGDGECLTFSPDPESTLPTNITVFYFHFTDAQPEDIDYEMILDGATNGYTSVPGCPSTPVFGATYCDPVDLSAGYKIFYPDPVSKTTKMVVTGDCT